MLDNLTPTEAEADRQIQICNACRYCEGYCAVFPAMFANRSFASGDLTQLANLCHNCRGCYYACQYTAPHEFDLNLPRVLAELRTESWERYAWPAPLARLFQRWGAATLALVAILTGLLYLAANAPPASGRGFYTHMPHSAMVAIFLPGFLLPLLAVAVGLRRYWRETGGGRMSAGDLAAAMRDAGSLRNLGGGQGQGCNFEKGDRFSNARRTAHKAVLWGFLLCFASTASGTVLHYAFNAPAPYDLFSLPKLLGLPGGVLLTGGAVWLGWLKFRAAADLGDVRTRGGEAAFTWLLAGVGATGLALYAATGTGLVRPLLALHLGAVLTFFVTLPYSKMAHGFYRMAALVRDAQTRRARAAVGGSAMDPSG